MCVCVFVLVCVIVFVFNVRKVVNLLCFYTESDAQLLLLYFMHFMHGCVFVCMYCVGACLRA